MITANDLAGGAPEPDLAAWLATLPPFGGQQVSLTRRASEHDGYSLFEVASAGQRAALKIFEPGSETRPRAGARSAAEKAQAEAAAMQMFAPSGVAPQLLWHGADIPSRENAAAVIYRWAEGEVANERPLSKPEASLYGRALAVVHGTDGSGVKQVSPNPRNLEVWWSRTHERYRDLGDEAPDMPAALTGILARLVQVVAADTQAHKRFWGGAALVPTHSSASPDKLVLTREGATLVDWQRFGLGDPSYEVALASTFTRIFSGAEGADALVAAYFEQVVDPILPPRTEIYRRVWPFGYALFAISDLVHQRQGNASGRKEGGDPNGGNYGRIVRRSIDVCLAESLQTYGLQGAADVPDIVADWLGALEGDYDA